MTNDDHTPLLIIPHVPGCTGTYSDTVATTLPGKLKTIVADVDPVKACMTDSTSAGEMNNFQ